MNLTWSEKAALGIAGVVLIGWLVLVSYLSATPTVKTDYHWGQDVKITSGFYKGWQGTLVKDNQNGTYTVSAVYYGGFLPVQVEAIVTSNEFEVIVDTTTGK